LRGGKTAAAKAPTSQQAHALSMVANLATADDVEQLVIG
jgi:uroporphyrin-III C-methyltransferase/precorrin-2 dehydrogenase/sirohydrochlorin ferrochelatase